MAMGPLESFVFPGVYVKTITEAAGASAAGDIRIPAFVGVSAETVRIGNFEMVRGSSAIADNLILDEDVNSPIVQLDGDTNAFTVTNFPIVTGDGSGKVSTSPNSVIVTVNGENVAVNAVNGLIGEVTLAQIPRAGDEVRANYYFKRRDTFIENEDISDQADGTTLIFKVKSTRIVKGDNGGRSATDSDISGVVNILFNPDPSVPGDEYERQVRVFQVKVNGSEVTVSHIDGSNGLFTLSVAPAVGAELLVTYFTNIWQDTYDILPASGVDQVIKVGLSQDTSDFSVGQDCVLSNLNRLHWGHSHSEEQGLYTAGTTPLVNNVVASITDTRVFGRTASPISPYTVSGVIQVNTNGEQVNLTGNKVFALSTMPVDGSGLGILTEDPSDIIAYVGTTWPLAFAAGPVLVTKMRGNQITLATAPDQTLEEIVFVTYYENLLLDDKWTLTNQVPGGAGIGKYTISSRVSGNALEVSYISGTVTPVYAGLGADNFQVDTLKGSVERVICTFDGAGSFTVTSLLGTGFTLPGRTGSNVTYNQNIGYTGKTYIDPTTGFRITFSGEVGLFNPGAGTLVRYDIGNPTVSDATEKLYITANSNIVRVVPGMNLTVSTTSGGAIDNTDDTVIIDTYNKSGNEPTNGDMYYVTFDKEKTDYSTRFLTNMRDVVKYFGPLDINNKCTLAANLAFLNGAQAVAIKQIKRAADGTDASIQDYIDGIDAFNEPLPNGLRPSLMQPLTTEAEVISYLKTSNAIQSSIRYKNERTSVFGFAVGTTPEQVIQMVQSLKTEKLTPIYPDGAIVGIVDAYGNEVEYIVDGSMIAAAVAGRDVSPVSDIATTLTNSTIVGFKRLYRRLDNVNAALVANSGCTVLEEQTPVIKILFYLTCDTSTALTRDPRIVEVKHFVQQGMRRALDRFIGVKNLPKIQAQVKDAVGSYFKSLKQKELIVNFTGISVRQNDQDPSTLDVEAYYSPVFPLNWIVVTLNLRQSL
jgi:hypothetical protein